MFKFTALFMPIYAKQMIEHLEAENEALKQQVAEQADALIELADIYEEEIDEETANEEEI